MLAGRRILFRRRRLCFLGRPSLHLDRPTGCIAEEVCDIGLVLLAVDWDDEGRGVIADFANLFADRVHLKRAVVRFQQRLQLPGPLVTGRVEPPLEIVGARLQDNWHAVVQELELFVGVCRDDCIRISLLLRAC